MNASDVMVHDPITVGRDDDISYAVKLLTDNDISALPVVDKSGRVIGILSEADLIRRDDLDTEKKRSSWIEAFTPSYTLAADFTKAHGRNPFREKLSGRSDRLSSCFGDVGQNVPFQVACPASFGLLTDVEARACLSSVSAASRTCAIKGTTAYSRDLHLTPIAEPYSTWVARKSQICS